MPDERLPYLFAVYAVTWAVFFVYTFFLTRRQHQMEAEIQSLRKEMEDLERSRESNHSD